MDLVSCFPLNQVIQIVCGHVVIILPCSVNFILRMNRSFALFHLQQLKREGLLQYGVHGRIALGDQRVDLLKPDHPVKGLDVRADADLPPEDEVPDEVLESDPDNAEEYLDKESLLLDCCSGSSWRTG